MHCPNINSPEWKSLVDKIGEKDAWREFFKYGEIPSADKAEEVYASIKTKTTEQIAKGIKPELIRSQQEIKYTTFIQSLVINKLGDISPNKKLSMSPDEAFASAKSNFEQAIKNVNDFIRIVQTPENFNALKARDNTRLNNLLSKFYLQKCVSNFKSFKKYAINSNKKYFSSNLTAASKKISDFHKFINRSIEVIINSFIQDKNSTILILSLILFTKINNNADLEMLVTNSSVDNVINLRNSNKTELKKLFNYLENVANPVINGMNRLVLNDASIMFDIADYVKLSVIPEDKTYLRHTHIVNCNETVLFNLINFGYRKTLKYNDAIMPLITKMNSLGTTELQYELTYNFSNLKYALYSWILDRKTLNKFSYPNYYYIIMPEIECKGKTAKILFVDKKNSTKTKTILLEDAMNININGNDCIVIDTERYFAFELNYTWSFLLVLFNSHVLGKVPKLPINELAGFTDKYELDTSILSEYYHNFFTYLNLEILFNNNTKKMVSSYPELIEEQIPKSEEENIYEVKCDNLGCHLKFPEKSISLYININILERTKSILKFNSNVWIFLLATYFIIYR